MRQALGERFPFVSAGSAAVDAQLSIQRKVLAIALDRNHVDRFRLVRVNVDHEAEIGGQIAADLLPQVAGVVAAHHVPVLLHEEHVRTRRVHGDAVDAVADLGGRVGNILRAQPLVDRLPGLAAVVGAEGAGGGDGDEDALGIAGIENDGVQAHSAGAGLPLRTGAVAAKAGKFLPGLAAVGGCEQRGVFHTGVDRVRIGERRFEMPDALEFPGMLRAVVPLMRGERLAGFRRSVVDELVALARRRAAGLRHFFPPGVSQVLPPSLERWIICPNQPLVCEA